MSREKQIEEMAKILCGMKNGCDGCMWDKVHCNERNYAVEIYNAGYRKQSEWISVDERLPDQYEDVLGFCHYVYESGGVFDLILTMKLTTDGKFVPFNCSPLKEGIVTHWMPLPEPPDTKGGA